MTEQRRMRGRSSELKVIAELTDMGYLVSEPVMEARYDFVVEIDGKLLRVQVKTTYEKNANSVTADVRTSRRDGNGGQDKFKYSENEVDVFALYNPAVDETYWVQFEEAGSRCVSINLADKETFQHRNGRIKFAEDYRLSEQLPG